ncbi:unnamed protein product [Symbiodinium sp. CCMP2592]|nr:unnamed protein product [Symbiodinium sp. CCMP2592]
MSSRLRPRSASLKALPPDAPCSPSIEVAGLAAGHWNVNSKEKPGGLGGQRLPHRPLKSVSLKLAKESSPTASTRSNSAGAAFGDLLLDARQCARQASHSSGPPSHGNEVPATQTVSTGPVPSGRPSQASRSRAGGEKMVSTAPAAVGRPPPPPKNPASSEVLTSSNRAVQRLPGDARSLSREEEDGLKRPSSASYQRAAAVYASLPKTPGGTRTLVPDADGFIFRPSVEAEPKPMPRGRPRPVSRGLASLTASVARSPKLSLHTASSAIDDTTDVPAPRIAWSEGIEDVPPDAPGDDMLAAAAQIRRDWLARQLMDDNEVSEASPDEQDSGRWHLRTEDGRRSLGELEKSLAKAKQRAERGRRELAGYLETLRSKTFQADEADAMKDEELLVSLPADFEDVVDINASLTAERRKSRHREPGASGDKGATPPGNTKGLSEDFKLPAFLEKYFFEEKAVEELPIMRLQVEEAAGSRESAVDKIARQIARLDTLLARREADGMARLKASKAEVEATKERLRRESEKSEAEKIELLKQLKERGFLRSNTSRATSAASSVQPSRSSSLAPSGAATPSSEAFPEQVMIDWSVWESSAETDAPSAIQSVASCPSASPREQVGQDEPDTSTFSLTSETADLSTLSGRGTGAASRASHKLEPVLEDVADDDGRLSADVEGVPPDQDEEPAALAMLTEDPYNLEALEAIDDKLAQLVPESEWEAKSIRSLRTGSEISAAGQSKISKPSVRSSALSSSVLPGEPLLREQHEDRENRKALIAINDRISQLQDEGSRRPSEQLRPEQLQQLLLQAVAAQPTPDVDDKVLSLQAGSMGNLVHVKHTAELEVAGPLSKAREILARLEQSKGDLDDVAVEAKSSWKEVEDSVRVLEQSSSQPPNVEAEDLEVMGQGATGPTPEMSTWATRLEDLAREASNVAENGVPAARGTLPAVDVDAFVRGDWGSADVLTIPTLSSARAGTDPEGSSDACLEWPVSEEAARLSDGHGLDNPEEIGLEGDEAIVSEWDGEDAGHMAAGDDYSLSDDDAPVFLPVAEIVEPAKALDLELPAGPWSDEDLERYSRMMDAHLVDAKSAGAACPS